jgi:aminoglycoside 6'-N-acetyltransferase
LFVSIADVYAMQINVPAVVTIMSSNSCLGEVRSICSVHERLPSSECVRAVSDKLLRGDKVELRRAVLTDMEAVVAIRATPEVRQRWRGEDLGAEFVDDINSPDLQLLVIVVGGEIVGGIQWSEETEPDYRHATMDIYLRPDAHGRGIGQDAIRTLAKHLFNVHDHHRISIDPAADNAAAIRCYTKVGFQPVGILRDYERGPDGHWHDALLMDLLAQDLT